jgi:hypothetical protein
VVLLLPRTQTTCRPPPPTFTARTVAGLLALGFELPAFAAWRSTDSEGGEVPSLFGALPAVVGPSEEGIALHVVVNVHWHEVAAESLWSFNGEAWEGARWLLEAGTNPQDHTPPIPWHLEQAPARRGSRPGQDCEQVSKRAAGEARFTAPAPLPLPAVVIGATFGVAGEGSALLGEASTTTEVCPPAAIMLTAPRKDVVAASSLETNSTPTPRLS